MRCSVKKTPTGIGLGSSRSGRNNLAILGEIVREVDVGNPPAPPSCNKIRVQRWSAIGSEITQSQHSRRGHGFSAMKKSPMRGGFRGDGCHCRSGRGKLVCGCQLKIEAAQRPAPPICAASFFFRPAFAKKKGPAEAGPERENSRLGVGDKTKVPASHVSTPSDVAPSDGPCRAWRRDAGQGISRKAVGLRPGLAPGPPPDSPSGVTGVIGNPTGRPRL